MTYTIGNCEKEICYFMREDDEDEFKVFVYKKWGGKIDPKVILLISLLYLSIPFDIDLLMEKLIRRRDEAKNIR